MHSEPSQPYSVVNSASSARLRMCVCASISMARPYPRIRSRTRINHLKRTGECYALRPRIAPRTDIPIWVLATRPKTLELAGRIADGVILLAELHVGHLAEDPDAADMAKIVATSAELLEFLAEDGAVVIPEDA